MNLIKNNIKRESNLLVVIGLQRTGTTLLASMLGRHPEINMLFESVTKDSLKLIGKKWNGNKLLAYRQIRQNTKSSKLGHLVNRIVNFDFGINRKHHLLRPFPTSDMCIDDYKKLNSKFITIERDRAKAISSMMKRAGQSEKQASHEYFEGMKIINDLKRNKYTHSVSFYDLTNNTEKILKEIFDFLELEATNEMIQNIIEEGPKYNIVYPNKKIEKRKA